jgi:hypothetical protein
MNFGGMNPTFMLLHCLVILMKFYSYLLYKKRVKLFSFILYMFNVKYLILT